MEEIARILTLDGGGAKGFYTLGVLTEIEAMVGAPLHQRFDLMFGTSTGSIIASLLALGASVADVHQLYRRHVPNIMSKRNAAAKTEALRATAQTVFGTAGFQDALTGLGVVAARWDFETPLIFKSTGRLAHGRRATFVPGFGCSIADAVQASCSAYPFFNRKVVITSGKERMVLVDGGYCANNPTLYAIADATRALQKTHENLRVISVGVGSYPEPSKGFVERWKHKFWLVQLLQKTMNINTQSMDRLRTVLFGDVPTVRVSDSFTEPEMATDFLEYDLEKLDLLFQRGRNSFGAREPELRAFLN